MKFLDQAKVYIRSGNGGAGCVSFRREAHVEYGGPDGGDGGCGGHVYATCVKGLNTLSDYRYQQHFKAATGGHGMGKNRSGKQGRDKTLKVPVGTQIFADDNATLIADLTDIGARILLAEGGNGGFGNARFKGPVNQSPRHANPGLDGRDAWLWLRLKLIADVGLLGLPNAGKSTLLAGTTRAKPKIADYPFTTLHPNLGVVGAKGREFVMADIPGLIKGASEGAGLGHRFLGHVERCTLLLHLVDGTQSDVAGAYRTIRAELQAYDGALASKLEIVALNKCDALNAQEIDEKTAALKTVYDGKVWAISGAVHLRIDDLMGHILTNLDRQKNQEAEKMPATGWHP